MRFLALVRVVLAIACSAASNEVLAQAARGIAPGARIRVETSNGDLVMGRVAMVRGDSLWLRAVRTDSLTVYSGASVRQYEISLGKDRWRGARRGAAITGAISLIAVGLVLRDDLTTTSDIMIPSTLFAAPLGLAFTLLGTGAGALIAGERWSKPETKLRIGAAPGMYRGIRVSYSAALF